jgi:hypothetical protein
VLFGISLGNVHCSGDGERIIGNDRRSIQISGESRGYGCEETGPHTLLTFPNSAILLLTAGCQVERDLGLHELMRRILEEDHER